MTYLMMQVNPLVMYLNIIIKSSYSNRYGYIDEQNFEILKMLIYTS